MTRAAPITPSRVTWSLLFLAGGALLLVGHLFPWPCLGNPDGCTTLRTHDLFQSWYGLLLAASLLLLPIYVRLLPSPFHFIVWLLFWFLVYLLAVAKINPFYMDSEIWFYSTFISVDRDALTVAQWLVLQLSLPAFWLAVRPVELRNWKVLALIALVALVLLTGFFFVSFKMAQHEISLLPSYHSETGPILGSGPLMIIAGAILLLAATLLEPRPAAHRRP